MDNTSYRTGSLQVASFLLATGHKMERHENGRYIAFVFSDNDGDVRKAVSDYYGGAVCKAFDFHRALIELRQIVRDARHSQAGEQ